MMLKFITLVSLLMDSISQPTMVGGQQDKRGCLIGAGYTWCDDSQLCIRQWETACSDNYSDCDDCVTRQSTGENIACPDECNTCKEGYIWCPTLNQCINPMKTPCNRIMEPDPVIDPTPMSMPSPCPEVMCMIYCEDRLKDDNGCDTCSCNDPMIAIDPNPPILTGIHREGCSELQNALINRCNSDCHHCDLSDTQVILGDCVTEDGIIASDTLCNGHQSSCPIPYNDCLSQYVCPKVTEITQCSDGGISGYTTYQLSLIKKDPFVKNIYAIYGGNEPTLRPMSFPPAYQGGSIFNNNLGGISPELIAINSDANYDSWLTIGLTNGDPLNKLSTIGVDFNSWTEQQGIYTTNGAIFVMDPEGIIITSNEYIIAQLTIPIGTSVTVLVNVQGKTLSDHPDSNRWNQEGIEFQITPPQPVNPDIIPPSCISWFDGCNTCTVNTGVLGGCTRMMCFREDNPHCLSFDIPIGH